MGGGNLYPGGLKSGIKTFRKTRKEVIHFEAKTFIIHL